VQFIVVVKGAERVAEVSARFTLDAMPGKQMSIDADLRAGTVTQEEAKIRRSNIEKENQLHGAMDGAMKFVKGDAIASIIIVAINILGGIAIGVMQKGWEIGKAVTTYSILTIGDGLVAQIPALLICITAGIIVTRVAGDEEGGALGGDVGKQLFAQPKALMLAAGFMFAFALVPGFPKLPFVILGTVAAVGGYVKFRTAQAAAETPTEHKDKRNLPAMAATGQKPAVKKRDESGDDFALTVPLLIDVSAASQDSVDANSMNDELIRVRKALYHDLGVPFPGIHLRFN
jgi:type III secretion protein V